MDEIKNLASGSGLNPWIYSTCVFSVMLVTLFAGRRAAWVRLAKWADRTSVTWDEELLEKISKPISVLLTILSFGVAVQSAPPVVRTQPLLLHGVKVAAIAVVVWLLDRVIAVLLRSSAIPENVTASTRTLFLTIGRAVIYSLGFLIVLDTIGVSITPVLASLGVGSVAVALALQDTLSNFFGGLYILIDKPMRLGDFVRIDDVEGQVDRIGWRSTWIKTLANDIIVLPNAKAAGAKLQNFDLPNSFYTVSVACSVAYGTDLERTERVTVDLAREVAARVPGANAEFAPAVRFNSFGDSAINFNVFMQVRRFSDAGLLRHEFIKALHVRFIQEGIEIPYPQYVVHFPTPLEPT